MQVTYLGLCDTKLKTRIHNTMGITQYNTIQLLCKEAVHFEMLRYTIICMSLSQQNPTKSAPNHKTVISLLLRRVFPFYKF